MNKTKGVIYAVILLVVGYIGGTFIGMPPVDNDKLGGDISKAKLYNNATGGYADADVERLCNDTLYQQQMAGSACLLAARVFAADSLVKATVAATGGISSLAGFHKTMKDISVKTGNAAQAFNALLPTMSAFIGGKTGGNAGGEEYEQQLNAAILAYTVVDNMTGGVPAFIETLAGYGKEAGNDDILALAGGWVEYGAEEAVFDGDAANIAIWQELYSDAKVQGLMGKGAVASFPSLENVVKKAEALGKINKTLGRIDVVNLNKVGDRTLGKIGDRTLGKIGDRSLGKVGDRNLGLKQSCINMQIFGSIR